MRELEALELQQLGEAPPQQGAAPAAPGPQQGGEDQRRAALQLSGEDAWRRRAGLAPAGVAGGGDGWGSSGGGLGLGGGGLGSAAAAPPPSSGQPKGMSLAQARALAALPG